MVLTESENLVRPLVKGGPGLDFKKMPYESSSADLVWSILVIDLSTIFTMGSDICATKGIFFD